MTAESRNELGLALQSSCHMWKKSSPLCLSPPCEALLYLQLILTELLGGRKMPKGRGGTRTACEGRTELVGYSSSYYFRDVPGAALTELKTTRSSQKSDIKILKIVTPSHVEIFKSLVGPIM